MGKFLIVHYIFFLLINFYTLGFKLTTDYSITVEPSDHHQNGGRGQGRLKTRHRYVFFFYFFIVWLVTFICRLHMANRPNTTTVTFKNNEKRGLETPLCLELHCMFFSYFFITIRLDRRRRWQRRWRMATNTTAAALINYWQPQSLATKEAQDVSDAHGKSLFSFF